MHRELKKLTSFGQNYEEKIEVEATQIKTSWADKFAEVSQQYERLTTDDVDVPQFSKNDIPYVTEDDVIEVEEENIENLQAWTKNKMRGLKRATPASQATPTSPTTSVTKYELEILCLKAWMFIRLTNGSRQWDGFYNGR